MTPLALLKKRYFASTDRVRYVPSLQGQRIDPEGRILVGDRAGPSLSVSNLAHELGHFVEIEDYRMAQHSWGLRVPEVWVLGTRCVEPTTLQITERELRVAAFQLNLLESVGYRQSAMSLVTAYDFLPDWGFVPLEDGRPAYGEEGPSEGEMTYRERNESRFRWLANRVTALRSDFTLNRFNQEWERKTALLKTTS